jgi:hypothetical protein
MGISELYSGVLRSRDDLLPVFEAGILPDGFQTNSTIHSAGVNVDITQSFGHCLGYRAFAGSRRPIDGNDPVAVFTSQFEIPQP